MSEKALELFLADAGCELPDESVADRKVELTMASIAAVNPEWFDVDAAKALNRGFLLENPMQTHSFSLTPRSLLRW